MADSILAVQRLDKSPDEQVIQRVIHVLDQAFAGNLSTRMLCCNQDSLHSDMVSMHVRAGLVGGVVCVAGYASAAKKERETDPRDKLEDVKLSAEEIVGAAIWFGPGQEMMGGPTATEQAKQGWFTFQSKLPTAGMRSWWMEFISEYSKFTRSSLSALSPTLLDTSIFINTCQSPPSPTSPSAKSHDWKLNNWHLQMLGVLPEYQSKGVGRELVARVMEKAKNEHAGICLETYSIPALRFYKRLRFKEYGHTMLHGYCGEDHPGTNGSTLTEPTETLMVCLAITPEEIFL